MSRRDVALPLGLSDGDVSNAESGRSNKILRRLIAHWAPIWGADPVPVSRERTSPYNGQSSQNSGRAQKRPLVVPMAFSTVDALTFPVDGFDGKCVWPGVAPDDIVTQVGPEPPLVRIQGGTILQDGDFLLWRPQAAPRGSLVLARSEVGLHVATLERTGPRPFTESAGRKILHPFAALIAVRRLHSPEPATTYSHPDEYPITLG